MPDSDGKDSIVYISLTAINVVDNARLRLVK